MYIWAKLSHFLHTLTSLASNKVKSKWTDFEQICFDEIKHIVTHDILSIHPDFNKRFDIHTDNSDCQLGEIISYDDEPIAFHRHKLTGHQTRYTVTEK